MTIFQMIKKFAIFSKNFCIINIYKQHLKGRMIMNATSVQQHMGNYFASINDNNPSFKRETVTLSAVKEIQKLEQQDFKRLFEETTRKIEEQQQYYEKIASDVGARRVAELKSYAKRSTDLSSPSQPTPGNRFYRAG